MLITELMRRYPLDIPIVQICRALVDRPWTALAETLALDSGYRGAARWRKVTR